MLVDRGVITMEILEGTTPSLLHDQPVASYIDQLLYTHALDVALCEQLSAYQRKIVSRVFASNFALAESWGYNRFSRIDMLEEEGYIVKGDDAASVDSSTSGALLFRFYIRPPSFALQAYEQRCWIEQLEVRVRQQAREIAELRRANGAQQSGEEEKSGGDGVEKESVFNSAFSTIGVASTSAAASSPPAESIARATPPSRITPGPLTTSSTSSAASAAVSPPLVSPNELQRMSAQLNAAEILHAQSNKPASSIPTNLAARPARSPDGSSSGMSLPNFTATTNMAAGGGSLSARGVPAASVFPTAPLRTTPPIAEVLKVHDDNSNDEEDDSAGEHEEDNLPSFAPREALSSAATSDDDSSVGIASSRRIPPVLVERQIIHAPESEDQSEEDAAEVPAARTVQGARPAAAASQDASAIPFARVNAALSSTTARLARSPLAEAIAHVDGAATSSAAKSFTPPTSATVHDVPD
jgi:hypothetical protein